jgi:hypothetical protein
VYAGFQFLKTGYRATQVNKCHAMLHYLTRKPILFCLPSHPETLLAATKKRESPKTGQFRMPDRFLFFGLPGV